MRSRTGVFGGKAMKFHYYPETDSLYIDLVEKPSADSVEVAPGVVLDFDGEGHVVGIDIDRASGVVDLEHVQVRGIPLARVQEDS